MTDHAPHIVRADTPQGPCAQLRGRWGAAELGQRPLWRELRRQLALRQMDLAAGLGAHGVTVVSGGAYGIDAAAHQAALDIGGQTVGVLGTGLEKFYPQRNRRLADAMIATGSAVLSEFPLDAGPTASNFPRRNRIISGLSLGVLVVEAALQSGSLITARLAAEQGKEVFAIPGYIHAPQ